MTEDEARIFQRAVDLWQAIVGELCDNRTIFDAIELTWRDRELDRTELDAMLAWYGYQLLEMGDRLFNLIPLREGQRRDPRTLAYRIATASEHGSFEALDEAIALLEKQL